MVYPPFGQTLAVVVANRQRTRLMREPRLSLAAVDSAEVVVLGFRLLMRLPVNKSSALWEDLSKGAFANIDREFLASFRGPGQPNGRLGTWDPIDHTLRYFKFSLFSAAMRRPDRFFGLYERLKGRDLGNPVTVSVRGLAIDIDYLLAIDEVMFIEQSFGAGQIKTITEIGAGFGRTCHALLTCYPTIERYVIVDLPSILSLSRQFLKEVIPDHLHKLDFIESTDRRWERVSSDLCINIDSFQEMPPATIDGYMQMIRHSANFYTRNPVAKYRPEDIGLMPSGTGRFKDVFEIGYCQDVIDIFNDEQIAAATKKYLDLYRPAPSWELVRSQALDLFPYYYHAAYSKAPAH